MNLKYETIQVFTSTYIPQFLLIIAKLHHYRYLLKYSKNTYHIHFKSHGNGSLLKSRHFDQTVIFFDVRIKKQISYGHYCMDIIAWTLLHGYDIIKLMIGRFWMMNAYTRDYCMAFDQSEQLISLISMLINGILPQ